MDKKSVEIRKLKSINRSMFGYFCLNTVIMLLIVAFIVIVVVIAGTFDSSKQEVTLKGEEIVAKINSSPEPYARVLEDMSEQGVPVFAYDSEYKQVYPSVGGFFNDRLSRDIKMRLGNSAMGATTVFLAGDNVHFAAVVDLDGNRGYVVIQHRMLFFKKSMEKLQITVCLAGLAAVALSLFLSYQFCKKITLGLNTTSKTAVAMANGDYDVKFANADYSELAALSDTLNFMRDEIKKSEDFQRELLANVTHDLKTPLTMIKAYASMIKEISGDAPEKREKHLQVIIDEADRLTGLVNDVLEISKIKSNLVEYNMKVFNLTELTYGVIEKFGYLQETQGYSFMIDVDDDLYTLGDEEKIYQVIYNLLSNASNYTGEDKMVYISLKSNLDGTIAKFSVRDTGKGISKEELPEIWDRYYRINENHVRPVKGTGLGLSIVKSILIKHAFRFGVESEEGKGSEFWIDFPTNV